LTNIFNDPSCESVDSKGRLKSSAVKSFVKYESYPTYKHCRIINSRDDRFKVHVGPIFHAIEKAIFKLKWFVKYVPVEQRPQYVIDLIGQPLIGSNVDGVVEGDDGLFQIGGEYFVTDHSQYEAAFTRDVMEDCEEPLYEFMLSSHPKVLAKFRKYYAYIKGVNRIKFRHFSMSCTAKRMSGEMNTSLGNGWGNLMSFLFECKRSNNKPTAAGLALNGFTVKLEKVRSIYESSFCGFMFHPDDKIIVKNPLDFLIQFGWLPQKYINAKDSVLMGLYRCKAISLLHSFYRSPIVDAFARYVLRMTSGFAVRQYYNDNYMYTRVNYALDRFNRGLLPKMDTPLPTRILVQDKFGISVEIQLKTEEFFNNLDTLDPINCPHINDMAPPENFKHYINYTMPIAQTGPEYYPVLNINRRPIMRDPDSLLLYSKKMRPALYSRSIKGNNPKLQTI